MRKEYQRETEIHMLTIAIPTLNSEKRITEVLDSLLAQTRGDFRVSILDNASSDRTNEVCKEYAAMDPRIFVFRQPKRLCMRDNFRSILEMADTEYFSWQQDDDILDADWVEITLGELESAPGINVAFSNMRLVKDNVEIETPDHLNYSEDLCTRLRQMFANRRFRDIVYKPWYGIWRTNHLKSFFFRLSDIYQNENLLGADVLLHFKKELDQDYRFIREKLITKRILSSQRTYRTDFTYGERYRESEMMISQGMQYLREVIEDSGYGDREKKQLLKIANIVKTDLVHASWSRRLKWRLIPWYRKRSKKSALDSDKRSHGTEE